MKEIISMQELLAQAGFKGIERFEYFDSGIVEVYSKIQPMSREEYLMMIRLNYSFNDDVMLITHLIEPTPDYLNYSQEIKEQIVSDYCFGETYMLED